MKNEAYIKLVSTTLLSFQMIEEGLKICIGMSYEVIQATTPAPIAFRFSRQSIFNASLERLIEMYKNITSNENHVEELKKIIKWRNFLAHNAFRHELMSRTGKSEFSSHSLEDVNKVLLFSGDLLNRLGSEIEILRVVHAEKVSKEYYPETEQCT